MQDPAGMQSRSRSASSIARMPSALASSVSASASVSDRTVSPVTSVTDGAASRGEEEKEKEKATKKGGESRVASVSASASALTTSKTTTTAMANISAVRRSSRARTSLTGVIGTYDVDVLADPQRKRAGKRYSCPAGSEAEIELGGLGMGKSDRSRGGGRGRGRSLSAADAAKAGYIDSRNVSGETLVNDDDDDNDVTDLRDSVVKIGDSGADAEKTAMRLSKSVDSLQKTDARQGMELQRMQEENQQKQSRKSEKVVRRQSTRLQHAANSARDVVSMLGKRGREAVDSGMDKAQALGRSGSTRLRDALRTRTGSSVAAATAGSNRLQDLHPAKKARLSSDGKSSSGKETSPVPVMRKKPRVKRWLASGLYTGQERDLNPRLKHSKNKSKSRSGVDGLKEPSQAEITKPRKYMPMPMFAGERLLGRGRPFSLPYDVFSPLSERQPKPNEWRKTSRNLFVGDALTVWKKAPKLEFSKCICTDQDDCDESCQNRFMLYECNDGNCNIGAAHCQNRAFAQLRERYKNGNKYDIGVEVLQTEGKGFGVRSNRSFEPGQIIVEYAGEIITHDECERRMKTVYKKNDCYYLMTFHQGMIIDATRGSIARFVNHSCEPNCRMVKWTVEGEPRMALFAGEGGIMTGDELTYDYNFDPFSQKNVQKCLCGAETCRGVLGPKVSERPKARVEAESQIAGVKRKSRDISRDSTSNDEDDNDDKSHSAKKAKVKAKSNKQDQKQKLSAAAKKTTSAIKNAITGETSIARQKNRDKQFRVGRAAMLSTSLSAASRPAIKERRLSGTSVASSRKDKNKKRLETLKANVPGKLQSPFRKLASNVKGQSSSASSSSVSTFAANDNAAVRQNSKKRRSLLQRATTSKANGSDSSLKPLVDDSVEKENNLRRRSVTGDDAVKSSATSGVGKLNAGVKRLVGKGGLGRRRTVSGAKLR